MAHDSEPKPDLSVPDFPRMSRSKGGRISVASGCVGAMGDVPLVSKAERSPAARSTEALQSCFCRTGRHSMTTGGRPESWRSTSRRRGARLWRRPRPRRIRLAEEKVENSRTGCAGAAYGRPAAQAHRGRVFLANPVSAGPFGSPWVRKGRTTKNRRPDRRARRQVTASLRTFARQCAAILLPSHCFPAHFCPLLPALVGIGRIKKYCP